MLSFSFMSGSSGQPLRCVDVRTPGDVSVKCLDGTGARWEKFSKEYVRRNHECSRSTSKVHQKSSVSLSKVQFQSTVDSRIRFSIVLVLCPNITEERCWIAHGEWAPISKDQKQSWVLWIDDERLVHWIFKMPEDCFNCLWHNKCPRRKGNYTEASAAGKRDISPHAFSEAIEDDESPWPYLWIWHSASLTPRGS